MLPLSGTWPAAAALRPGRVGRVEAFVVWVAAERSVVEPAGKQASIVVRGPAAALRRVPDPSLLSHFPGVSYSLHVFLFANF